VLASDENNHRPTRAAHFRVMRRPTAQRRELGHWFRIRAEGPQHSNGIHMMLVTTNNPTGIMEFIDHDLTTPVYPRRFYKTGPIPGP
jgi:hypothetical protein